jgi:hypothetical protein
MGLAERMLYVEDEGCSRYLRKEGFINKHQPVGLATGIQRRLVYRGV